MRKSIKNIVFFVLTFFFILSVCSRFCYAGDSLTWRDCVREARKNHPDVISAKEQVRQARADEYIAVSAFLPHVTSDAQAKRSKTAAQTLETNTYSYGLSGQQLVFDGFKTAADVGNSSKTVSAEQYNHAVISSNVRLNLRVAFVSLLRGQDLITLTESIAERRKQNMEMVWLRYEAGREHKGSLLTAEADTAQAEYEVAQAKRNLSLVQRELSKELGRLKAGPIKAEGNFNIDEASQTKQDFEYLAENVPFLRELIAKKDAARLNYASAQSNFFPEVYLNTSYSDTASESDWPPVESNKAWSASLSVSLPIFEGGERFSQAKKARSQWKQAQADERSGRDSVLVTLEKTWKDLQDAVAYVSVQKMFLEAANERAKIAGAQYESGLISFDDWIIIENSLVTYKKSHLNAQADMLDTEARWIQAKGGTLEYDKE
ncbi:TolC family protein [Candidatus Omnitrophota bacterium]